MYKYTNRGIERIGGENEVSQEDREFIRDLFEDFSDFEKPIEDRRNRVEDRFYEE